MAVWGQGSGSDWGGSGRCFRPLGAETGGEVGPEGGRVEAVDERVAAGVQVPEDEEGVVNVLRCDAQHVGLEPVPDPQQVVRRPADQEGQHDDHRHLQRLQTGLGDDGGSAAAQVGLTCWEATGVLVMSSHTQGTFT